MKGNRTVKILTKIYYWLLSSLAVVGMLGYIGAVVVQVFSRTFLPSVPSWTEEAARYLFIYSVAVGAGVVSMKDEYARVDILTSKFSEGFKKIYEIIVCLILIAFDVYLACYSIPKFVFLKFRMVSTAMQIPMQWINFSVLLFAVLQAVSYSVKIILLLFGTDTKDLLKSPEEETIGNYDVEEVVTE